MVTCYRLEQWKVFFWICAQEVLLRMPAVWNRKDLCPPGEEEFCSKVLSCEAPPWGPAPYLSIYFFWGNRYSSLTQYFQLAHDVTKIQTKELSILPRFFFHDALEQLKTKFHTNFRSKGFLDLWYSTLEFCNLLRDAAFTLWPRELSCRLKKWLISGNFAI